MSGNRVVLDTNVIIFASKQQLYLGQILEHFEQIFVSIVTYMEVYGYNFSSEIEKQLLDNFFNHIEIVDVDILVAAEVVNYRLNNSKKIKLPDAIILATSKVLNATLLTDDWDDFEKIDPDVQIFTIDNYKIKE